MPRDCTRLVAACGRRPGRQTMWITPAWHSKERLAEECFFSAAPGDALTARSSRMVAAMRPAMLAGRRPSRGLGCWRCNATGAPRSSLLPARKAPAHTKAVKMNGQERESARHQTRSTALAPPPPPRLQQWRVRGLPRRACRFESRALSRMQVDKAAGQRERRLYVLPWNTRQVQMSLSTLLSSVRSGAAVRQHDPRLGRSVATLRC